MEQTLLLSQKHYDIPTVLCLPDDFAAPFPAVILCHGTGSHKDEVGDLFRRLADKLARCGIASVRFDFAGCGDSRAAGQQLTFLGEVQEVLTIYQALCQHPSMDPDRIGILGFSQGARVMAEFLKTSSPIATAVSWSGACHDGPGVFSGWYPLYYEEAVQKGFARIPMGWRDDLLVCRAWFDEIRDTRPMDGFSAYSGPVLAIAGTADNIVPCQHAQEILARCTNADSRARILPGADHTFCVLTENQQLAEQVLAETVIWFRRYLSHS